MFDFSQIAKVGETLEQATRDLDSRLEQIANQQEQMILALAVISERVPIEPILVNNEDVVLALNEIAKLLDQIERNTRWQSPKL